MYNETGRVMPPVESPDAVRIATALREIGEYLHDNFKALL